MWLLTYFTISMCCRVNIPVIIMGETGCGKTKLIEFMSKLQVPTMLRDVITSMLTVKVSRTAESFHLLNWSVCSIDPSALLIRLQNRSVCCSMLMAWYAQVHGGTTEETICKKVNEAVQLARENKKICEALAQQYNSKLVSNAVASISIYLLFDNVLY